MSRLLKMMFFGIIVKPVVFVWLGLNVFFRERLPQAGPAILAANHNSHLDTMVMMSLYPLMKIHRVRPVAAADYFLSNKVLAWFSLNVIGIIPLTRTKAAGKSSLFDECQQALDNGDILLLFPEGSRGNPEQLGELKRGIHLLVRERSDVPVIPVAMYGLGRALPKGEALLVPFNCDVVIGEALPYLHNSRDYISALTQTLNELLQQCLTRHEEIEE